MRRIAATLLLCAAACSGDDDGGETPDAALAPPDAAPVGQGSEPRNDVAINEIVARPTGGEDWIELVNRGAAPVDLSGHYLTDAPDRIDHYYAFPAGTTLAPGAYLVIAADDGVTGARFELGAADSVFLLDPDGLTVDGVFYLARTDGASLARVPDHEGLFWETTPTPGAANR